MRKLALLSSLVILAAGSAVAQTKSPANTPSNNTGGTDSAITAAPSNPTAPSQLGGSTSSSTTGNASANANTPMNGASSATTGSATTSGSASGQPTPKSHGDVMLDADGKVMLDANGKPMKKKVSGVKAPGKDTAGTNAARTNSTSGQSGGAN
jgi:hypothetical protein